MTKEIIYLEDMKNAAMNCFNFLISNLNVHENEKGQFVWRTYRQITLCLIKKEFT
jgi:hypothetical protein